MSEYDLSFPAMGTDVRIMIGEPVHPSIPSQAEAAATARAYVEEFDARLSRFRPESELCRLNRDEREEVPASQLLRAAVSAGVWAARESAGLVDPTLVTELEAVGYAESKRGVAPAPLAEALAAAPARRPARGNQRARWRAVEVDDVARVVRRPPGVRFDTGGCGKGLCADAVAHLLQGYSRFVVDCGGDIRVGGPDARVTPYNVEIEHPLTGGCAATAPIGDGGIATSGLNSRIWRTPDGGFAHHLIDPSSGKPAWPGLISATSIAPSALEAETTAKAALLSGPANARWVLRVHGGVVVHEDGRVEIVTPAQPEPTPEPRFRRRSSPFAGLAA
jgi:thiamine biosynthesis lipoprotein